MAGSVGGKAKANKRLLKNVAPPAAGAASPYAKALADTGVSQQAASRYQALADVPKAVFQQALADPVVKPTVRAVIAKARAPQPKMPDDVLWLWGRMRDFERDGFGTKNPVALLEPMTDSMRADVLLRVHFALLSG